MPQPPAFFFAWVPNHAPDLIAAEDTLAGAIAAACRYLDAHGLDTAVVFAGDQDTGPAWIIRHCHPAATTALRDLLPRLSLN